MEIRQTRRKADFIYNLIKNKTDFILREKLNQFEKQRIHTGKMKN